MVASALTTAPSAHAESISLPLRSTVAALPAADEEGTGYDRGSFRHWIDADHDGCTTRSKVVPEEAVGRPSPAGAPSTAAAGTAGTSTSMPPTPEPWASNSPPRGGMGLRGLRLDT
ncbi:hypothetical protein GCM10010319_23460 [Streptomyces blastmyceticus]|uniref:Uncharacterized protein n=1 Tax=Streptomyces blastmyceticus TaxID=68180 RepID=A0ABN0WTG5_9ACTN